MTETTHHDAPSASSSAAPRMDPSAALTGGCQCGAVRYRAARLGRASICHCRMCQKAFGGVFGPLVTAHGLEWTRGERQLYRSSNRNRRGFCATCGTPLTYETDGASEIEVAIGSLDDPACGAPTVQVNPSEMIAFTPGLAALPLARDAAADAAANAGIVSYQHPDHDTDVWPPDASA